MRVRSQPSSLLIHTLMSLKSFMMKRLGKDPQSKSYYYYFKAIAGLFLNTCNGAEEQQFDKYLKV